MSRKKWRNSLERSRITVGVSGIWSRMEIFRKMREIYGVYFRWKVCNGVLVVVAVVVAMNDH